MFQLGAPSNNNYQGDTIRSNRNTLIIDFYTIYCTLLSVHTCRNETLLMVMQVTLMYQTQQKMFTRMQTTMIKI